jgi:hypothetical protein
MPERLRDIASKLRELVGNRRHAPRYPARLDVTVSLVDTKARGVALEGHTFDVSLDGAGIVLPAIRIGDRYLTGDEHVLSITLHLPSTPVQFRGKAVRHERIEEEEGVIRFALGVRIVEMSERDRSFYEEFLAGARRKLA